jgi:hypothetical protein
MRKMLSLIVPLLLGLSCMLPDRGTAVSNDGTGVASGGLSASYDQNQNENATATIDDLVGEASSMASVNETQGICTSTANCDQSPPASCELSVGQGACSIGVDQDCSSGQQGYAECNGVRAYCPACGCREGATRSHEGAGCCCGGNPNLKPGDYWPEHLRLVETCMDGAWVTTAAMCDGGTCAGGPVCHSLPTQ